MLNPRVDGYARQHPQTADVLLLIEVADRSLERDRDEKIPAYARARISEVWLVNLCEHAIVWYQDPGPEGYRRVRTAARGETIAPLDLPDLTLRVDEMLG